MLELIVLFALAALGSFFRSDEEERMDAVAIPVPTGPTGATGARRERAIAQRVLQPVEPKPAPRPAQDRAHRRADEALMADLGARLAAEDAEVRAANRESETTDPLASAASQSDDVFWGGDDLLFGNHDHAVAAQADMADPAGETAPAPIQNIVADSTAEVRDEEDTEDTIVVVLPADYAGRGEVSLRDAPPRDGRPAAHVLIDGQVVAELAGTRAADIPLDSISVVEEEAEEEAEEEFA